MKKINKLLKEFWGYFRKKEKFEDILVFKEMWPSWVPTNPEWPLLEPKIETCTFNQPRPSYTVDICYLAFP